MRKLLLLSSIFHFFMLMIAAQVQEYRFTIISQGKTEAGLHKIRIATEVNDGNNETIRWKAISTGVITTGQNVSMAIIQQDSVGTIIPYKQLLADEHFKSLWQRMLEQYLKRMDQAEKNDPLLNQEDNNTSNQIWKDGKIINISIKAGKEEKEAYIYIAAVDNSRAICMNKNLRIFAGNYIEVNTQFLPAGTYWVYVSTAANTFSKKIMIY